MKQKIVTPGYKLVKDRFQKFVEIPNDWTRTKIGKECKLSSGSTPSREHSEFFNGDILWVNSGELDYNVIKDTEQHITDEAVKEANLQIHPPGTFLIAITGLEAAGTRGRCAILGKEATTNQSCMAFYPNEKLLPKFLFYYYQLFGESLIFQLAQGTKQQSLNGKLVKSISISLPSREEQEKIISILDNLYTVIENQNVLIKKFQRIKSGYLQKFMTQGINHTKFKKETWLFGKEIRIPEEWEIKKLEDLVDILDSKRIPIEESEREDRHGEYPYYGASGIIDYIDDYIFDEKLLCLAEDGENLRSRVLPIAFTIENKTWVNNHAHVLRVKNNTEHYFLEYFLNNLSLLKYVASTAQPKLNQKDMCSIPIIYPKKTEQQKIVSILLNIDYHIQGQTKYYKNLKSIKKSLMDKLLTGQKRINP